MQRFATPDITTAQVGAIIKMIVGQIVAWGLLPKGREQIAVSVGTFGLASVWMLADAVIRHGRATGTADRTQHTITRTITSTAVKGIHGGGSTVVVEPLPETGAIAPTIPAPAAHDAADTKAGV